MQNHIERVRAYLIAQPLARERKNKHRTIGNLLGELYGTPIKELRGAVGEEVETTIGYSFNLSKEDLKNMLAEAQSLDRAWRKCLELYPELRGKDYNQKFLLEEKKKEQVRGAVRMPYSVA